MAGAHRRLRPRDGAGLDAAGPDFFELADEVGFDWVSVAEHHYAPRSLTPNPMVMAGAPPSGSSSNPYVTYGVNPAESRERFIEALALIVRPWTEPQPFGWLGRYHEYRTISIWPRPVQEPHPPIFMSISSPEMAEFAATHRISAGLRPGRPARATPAVPGRASRPPDTVPAVRRTTSPTG